MHYRKLGGTGLVVSCLGMGSSSFRNDSPEASADLLELADGLGITYFDTARSYVNGEEAVGHLSPSVKKRMVITTKTGARGGSYCLHDLQRSLKTMKRDWIDVWMTHMVHDDYEYDLCTSLGGFCDIAAAAKQAGLVRATGASFHAPTSLILRAIEERAFDVVMFQLNLIGRETVFGSSIASYRDVLIPAAREHGIGIVVMKVLAGGELRHGASKLVPMLEDDTDGDSITAALRYATMHPDVASAVVGMSTSEELVQNVRAVEGIDDSLRSRFFDWSKKVEGASRGDCTRCGVCLGVCPENIEIPKVMRLHDQMRFFGMDGVARYKYSLMEVDAAVCSECRKCQEVCPENFDIAAHLRLANGALSRPFTHGRARSPS
jgi:uncharacterized protein